MSVEWARSEDLAEIIALERASAEAPHWAESEYCAALSGGDVGLARCLFVVRDGRELLGFAVGRVVVDTAEIESVAVRASSRRLGVGRSLCAAVIGWAWDHAAERVELEVRAESRGAQALYAELGFRECGRRPAYYRDPVSDAVLMRLERAGWKWPRTEAAGL